MAKTTDIRPVREKLGELTGAPQDDWQEPLGRLFGLRSRLVHGEADRVPADAATLVELIANTLLTARLLDRVPAALEADLFAASGLPRRDSHVHGRGGSPRNR